MAFITGDRVKETSSSTGTGDFTLDGAASGFKAFGDVAGIGDTVYYAIYQEAAGDFEVGIGSLPVSTSTLQRDTVLSSSNADALVNFGVGGKVVFITAPAEKIIQYDNSNNLTLSGATFDTDFSSNITLDAGGSIFLQDSGSTQLTVSNGGVVNNSGFLWATTGEITPTVSPFSEYIAIGPDQGGDWGYVYAGLDDFLHIGNNRAGVSVDVGSIGDFKVTNNATTSLIEADLGSVRLYDGGSLKLQTTSVGVSVTGSVTASSASISGTVFADSLDMNDNEDIRLGTGDDTLMYFDGTHYIHNQVAGNIRFQANGTDTVSILPAGDVYPGTTGTQDLGSTGLRWNIAYVNNLNIGDTVNYRVLESQKFFDAVNQSVTGAGPVNSVSQVYTPRADTNYLTINCFYTGRYLENSDDPGFYVQLQYLNSSGVWTNFPGQTTDSGVIRGRWADRGTANYVQATVALSTDYELISSILDNTGNGTVTFRTTSTGLGGTATATITLYQAEFNVSEARMGS